MSDTTYHLEESLTHLTKINQVRAQKANVDGWNAMDEAERKDAESELKSAERFAGFPTSMGRDHAELIRDITATTKEPFLTGEIVDRLAASLDENLTNLVGPKMQELKLSDPERFSFKPKPLLAAIAQIYLNLGTEPAFIRAVANDGRSYSKELFERFGRVLKHRAIMTEAEADAILAFADRVENARATIEEEDEREIPDEFLGTSLTMCHLERTLTLVTQTLYSLPVSFPGGCTVLYTLLTCRSDEGPCYPARFAGDNRPQHHSCGTPVQGAGPIQQHAVRRKSKTVGRRADRRFSTVSSTRIFFLTSSSRRGSRPGWLRARTAVARDKTPRLLMWTSRFRYEPP